MPKHPKLRKQSTQPGINSCSRAGGMACSRVKCPCGHAHSCKRKNLYMEGLAEARTDSIIACAVNTACSKPQNNVRPEHL